MTKKKNGNHIISMIFRLHILGNFFLLKRICFRPIRRSNVTWLQAYQYTNLLISYTDYNFERVNVTIYYCLVHKFIYSQLSYQIFHLLLIQSSICRRKNKCHYMMFLEVYIISLGRQYAVREDGHMESRGQFRCSPCKNFDGIRSISDLTLVLLEGIMHSSQEAEFKVMPH